MAYSWISNNILCDERRAFFSLKRCYFKTILAFLVLRIHDHIYMCMCYSFNRHLTFFFLLNRRSVGRVNEAEKYFNEAIKIDPSYAEALNKLAVLSFNANNHKKCIKYALKVTTLNPRHFGALGGSAVSQRGLGEPLAAIKNCRLSLLSHPWAANVSTVLNFLCINEKTREDIIASGSVVPDGYFPGGAGIMDNNSEKNSRIRTEINLDVHKGE